MRDAYVFIVDAGSGYGQMVAGSKGKPVIF